MLCHAPPPNVIGARLGVKEMLDQASTKSWRAREHDQSDSAAMAREEFADDARINGDLL